MARKKKIFLIVLPVGIFLALFVLGFSVDSFLATESCGCMSVEKNPVGVFVPEAKIAYFQNKPIDYDFAQLKPDPSSLALREEAVLGVTTDERWIEIDLSEQRLLAHQGDRVVYDFLVSTGKWGRTPVGEYRVWLKLKYTKMSGGSREKGTYYYLPNVPYVMYFYKGFGIHGTYWHQNFGQPMSHGCVNMATPEAERIFYWSSPVLPEGKTSVRASKSNPGIKVVIHQ